MNAPSTITTVGPPPAPGSAPTPVKGGGRPARGGIDFPGLLLAMFLAWAWTQAMFLWRPDALFTDDFIVHDHGQNLFLIEELFAGRLLYRDVSSVYGPLPVLVHWMAARVFGNTAATYLHLWQALSVVGAGMLFCSLRRVASRWLALAWLALAVYPLFLMPTAARATLAYTLYPGFERLAALGLALLWRPPSARGPGRTAALGALLGGMQLAKFGIALPAGVALLATDALTSGRVRGRSGGMAGGTWMFWLRQGATLLVGFAVVEVAWAAALLAVLPVSRVVHLLWPIHLVGSYRTFITPDLTYFGFLLPWRDVGYFVGQQLPVASAALLTLSLLARWCYRGWREQNAFGLATVPFRKVASTLPATGDAHVFGWSLFLAIYFPVTVVTVGFPHWVGTQSEWMAAAAALAGFVLMWTGRPTTSDASRRGAWGWRRVCALGLAAGFLPSAFLGVKQLRRHGGEGAAQPVTFANGEKLWLSPASRAGFEKVHATLTLQSITPETLPKVLFVPMASGWRHYFGYRIPEGTRHRWIMAGLVPRDEEPGVLNALGDADALVFTSRRLLQYPVGPDPGTWPGGHNPGFSDATNRAFRSRLREPIPIDNRITIFPTR